MRQQYREACHLARLVLRKGWYTEYWEWWNEFPSWMQDHAMRVAKQSLNMRLNNKSQEDAIQ